MTSFKSKANARRTNTKSQGTPVQAPAGKAAEARNPDRACQPNKLDVIHGLLARTDGATLGELVTATGWQPHSVRAGMTSLRKQGLTIMRTKVEGATRFAIETHSGSAAA